MYVIGLIFVFSFSSNEDLTCGKSYDTLDDFSTQFDFDRIDTKVKSTKKPNEKFFINETIYETEDFEELVDDDFVLTDEVEAKRYKCPSPRRRHRSLRSPELDLEFDDFEFTPSYDETTVPVDDMLSSQRRTRTYSNSSETDEYENMRVIRNC